MAWTAPRTWVAGETVTAALMNTHLRDDLLAMNGYVLKTADESVTSSAVLQNDDHLLYAIGAAGTYLFDVWLYALSAANAAGDIQCSFSFPTGTCHWGGVGADSGLASGHIQTGEWVAALSATSGVTNIGFGLSTISNAIHLHGILVATSTGTLRAMWAQGSSNVNASTVKAGSHMIVKQVA